MLRLIAVLAAALMAVFSATGHSYAETACETIGKALFELAVTSHDLFQAKNSNDERRFEREFTASLEQLQRQRTLRLAEKQLNRKEDQDIQAFVDLRLQYDKTRRQVSRDAARDFYQAEIADKSFETFQNATLAVGCPIDQLASASDKSSQRKNPISRAIGLVEPGRSLKTEVAKKIENKRKKQVAPPQESYFLYSVILIPSMAGLFALVFVIDYFDKRNAKRHLVTIKAFLIQGNSKESICILDVSQTGAKFRSNVEISKGDRISIGLLGGQPPIAAIVRWTNNNIAGVQFNNKVTRRTIRQVRKAAA